MRNFLSRFILTLAGVLAAMAAVTQAVADQPITIESRYAEANGIKLHYLVAGTGEPVLLLHGYAQTSHMWRPLMAKLAATHTVIAPDLRGFGASAKPESGYEKKILAQDIHALAGSLGHQRVAVVGHDIGLMVAYAYAAQYPSEVDRIVLMDAFLPGVGEWKNVWLLRDLWHFHFYGETPLKLVAGRERTYFEHFWNDFAADGTRSIPEADRQAYAADYARPGRMRAAWAYFVSFQQAAVDFERFSRTKLAMPVLTVGGEKANGVALAEQGRLVATNSSSLVLAHTGHWIMEESPRETQDALVRFIAGEKVGQQVATPPASSMLEMRLTPEEAREIRTGSNQIGSSHLPGVSTTVLVGDPSKTGFYAIVLSVPPNTTIPAHSHRDDRMATVISGTWQIGYGDRFDERALKTLPPGSVYSEPGGGNHFARTGAEAVLVEISGVGPTDTRSVEPAQVPGPQADR